MVCPPGSLRRAQSGCEQCPLLPFARKLPVGDTAGGALPHLSVSGHRWSASPRCQSCSCSYGNTENRANGCAFICLPGILYYIPLIYTIMPSYSNNLIPCSLKADWADTMSLSRGESHLCDQLQKLMTVSGRSNYPQGTTPLITTFIHVGYMGFTARNWK